MLSAVSRENLWQVLFAFICMPFVVLQASVFYDQGRYVCAAQIPQKFSFILKCKEMFSIIQAPETLCCVLCR